MSLPPGFTYTPNVFTWAESEDHFAWLRYKVKWERPKIKIVGQEIPVGRLVASYGAPINYSGIDHPPAPMPERVLAVLDRVREVTGEDFNACLLNLYRDGTESVAWHRDSYGSAGDGPIASVSFGGIRRFSLRKFHDHSKKAGIDLESGSLLVMGAGTQGEWQHSIPRTSQPVQPRVNLTFRQV